MTDHVAAGPRRKPTIEPAEYDRRRQALKTRFMQIGHGSQQAASFDLRVHSAMVANTLNGRGTQRDDILESLEKWVIGQPTIGETTAPEAAE